MLFRSLSFLLLSSLLSMNAFAYPTEQPGEASSENQLPLDELRRFAEVFSSIKKSYVEPVTDQQLLEDAIAGMVRGLDPHSDYLIKEAFDNLQEHTNGEFGGLGIEVGMKDGFVHVITPLDDTPAQEAGIKAGDLITKLGDTPIQGMSLSEAVKLMRGKIGEPIRITIMREGVEAPFEVELVRAAIKIRSVRSRLLEPGFGYVRISEFQANTGQDLLDALAKLQKDEVLKGLVLDLRNNPGGVLQAAVAVSDAFLDEGLIVYTEGRIARSELEFNATDDMAIGNVPLIVLINGGSASASEIVAGALQDQKRAVIMGTQSFGKGSVQTVVPLSEDRAVKITTARYFTPNGRSIQAQGISPDVVVEELQLDRQAPSLNQVREVDLAGHLENESEGAVQSSVQADLASDDFQLYQALTMLKALNILNR
jgi:carboxyl-terminal processing protease